MLQAFSRTNRILNRIKTFGNIVCFRDLEKATNDAIALFGNKEAGGIVLLKHFDEYYQEYDKLIAQLLQQFPLDKQIVGQQAKKEFIKLYGQILRLHNILNTFDEFTDNQILSDRDMQDYHSIYLDLYDEFRTPTENNKEDILDDIVFEIELIKQIDITVDYILELITKYYQHYTENTETLNAIYRAIDSSVTLRNKKELILQFIALIDSHQLVDKEWPQFVTRKKDEALKQIIDEEPLNEQATIQFMNQAFQDGFIDTNGTAFGQLVQSPHSRFSPGGERAQQHQRIYQKLAKYFDIYHDIAPLPPDS